MFSVIKLSCFQIFLVPKTFLSTNSFIRPSGQVFIKNKHQRFIDSLRITVTGGAGGNGYPKYQGLGGNGGNVCLLAKSDAKLSEVKNAKKSCRAEDGQHSSKFAIIARDGRDLEIKVPTGITVVLDDFQKEIAELNQENDKVIVAFGGRGGDKLNSYCGTKGQKLTIRLDLKLLADVGLIGYPNAGKSTLLRALSRASPKIASYPFTTVQPNLGVIEYDPQKSIRLYSDRTNLKQNRDIPKHFDQDYRRITVADLPGLIDGAHRNIGLGHKFLKHIIRTNILLFVVDIDGFKNTGGKDYHEAWHSSGPIEVIQSLVKEIDLYDSHILKNKRSILVVSKLDTSEKRNQFNQLVETLKNTEINIPSRSIEDEANIIIDHENNDNIKYKECGFKFDKIVGISSVKNYNIERLKGMIRNLIDHQVESKKHQQPPLSFRQLQADEHLQQQQQQQQRHINDLCRSDDDNSQNYKLSLEKQS